VTPLGWAGVWLLVAAFVAIVAEGVLAVVWGRAVAKRSRALQERIETERGLIEADLKLLQEALEETRTLWRPYRGALRWLRHPITIALMQSYAGRRVGR
jgi:hypothetical protein